MAGATGDGEFPAQMVNNAENISIWWRHYEYVKCSKAKLYITKLSSFVCDTPYTKHVNAVTQYNEC